MMVIALYLGMSDEAFIPYHYLNLLLLLLRNERVDSAVVVRLLSGTGFLAGLLHIHMAEDTFVQVKIEGVARSAYTNGNFLAMFCYAPVFFACAHAYGSAQ